MVSGNILWKFELDQITFIDFTGIESLKYKEIRVSGAKFFLGVYAKNTENRLHLSKWTIFYIRRLQLGRMKVLYRFSCKKKCKETAKEHDYLNKTTSIK